MKIVEDGR